MGRPLTSIYRTCVIEGIEGMGLVFLVTGSSRELGRQIVEQALASGHRVVASPVVFFKEETKKRSQ